MADVADYSEWKTGRRATGIVFSALVFGLKVGLGLGGGIGGRLLSLYGYAPNALQTAHALVGIRMTASVFSCFPFFLGVVCLFFYKIDTEINIRMTNELAERRRKYATPRVEIKGSELNQPGWLKIAKSERRDAAVIVFVVLCTFTSAQTPKISGAQAALDITVLSGTVRATAVQFSSTGTLNDLSCNIGWAHRAWERLATCAPLACARVNAAVRVMPVPETCAPAACA